MKKFISLMLAVTMLSTVSFVNISKAEESQNTIYVSENTGNDYYDGSENKPLKTIEAAKLKARELEGNVTIEIMGGEYVFTSPLELVTEDSNVTYKAYSNEKPVFKGSLSIPTEKVNIVTDTEILDKLNENVKEKVYVIDLGECGLTGRDIVNGSLANSQYGISAYKSNFNTFYIDGEPMEIAQWPNGRDYAQHLGKNDDTSIIYDGNYPDRWAGANDWWVGLWIPYDYAYYTFGGVEIDKDNNILKYIANPAETFDASTYSKRWKAYNLIEELDVAGEYFIDRTNMKLYFYPGEEITNQEFEIDVNLEKIISIENASNITFEGIEFSNTNGSAIKATDVENIDILNCTFKNIGYNALNFNGSQKATTGCYKNGELWWQYQNKNGSYDVDIKGNIFNNIGSSAIKMGGAGDVDNLISSRNYIENNIIYNAGFKSVIHAIDIGGCGVTVRNNNISRLSTGAITMLGNNHLIEYNEIYDAITEAVDAGVIYQGGSDFYRGTVVQYNYIHDIKTDDNKTYEGLKNGLCGIYWDEGQQGMTANNNILVNIPNAFNSNYAGNFLYKYNIAVDCEREWSLHDADSRKWPVVTRGYAGTLAEIAEMITNKELYYATYSNLEEYLTKGTNPKKWTVIEENLSVNCDEYVGTQDKVYATFTNNKDADKSIFVNPSIQDYRLLKSSAISQEIPELINEDFNIDLIGIQSNSSFGDELSEFDVIYPKNNQSIEYSDEYTFVWEPSFGANQYKIIVAKDKDFTDIVFSKETVQTQATVTGLSDNTVYYWKVQAKNISRELSGEWQTKGEAIKFAVGGLYGDSVAQNIPENMILVAADCESFDAETNGDMSIIGYNFKWSINTGYKNYGYQYMATELDPVTWYKVGPLGKGKSTIDYEGIEAGKNYVVSAWAKDVRETEDVERTEFSVSMKYDLPAGGDKNIFTKEYPEGSPMELTDSWQQFAGTIKIPEEYGSFRMLEFGVPTTNEFIVGQGFRVDELYFAEEAPYEIKLETDNNKIMHGSEIEVNASLLNQVGKTGYLNQEFDWFVTDLDRKEIINGFQITETTDGVKVSAPITVESGKYVLIAKSDDILKGIEIEVSHDFTDKTASIPENMIIKDAGCSNINAITDKDFTRLSYNYDFDVVESGYNGNAYRFMANTTGAEKAYKVVPVGKNLTHMSGDFEKGKNYVISAWVKDARTTETVPFTEFSVAVMNDSWTNIWSGSKITLSNEWQQYAETFTPPSNYTSLKYIQFGAPSDNTFSVGQGFMMDEIYVAEEAPYEIKLETDNNKITLGSEIDVNASLLNQGGKKGCLNQEFEWFVTDENRKEIIDGFQITETTNGVKVTAPLTVESGKYVLIARSNDILKGIEIEVSNDFSDKTVAKPENLITVDAGCSDWDAYNTGKAARLGWNFHFTATTDGAYNGVSYYIYADTRYGAEPSLYKVGPIGKNLNHMSGDLEAGKNYIISAMAKDKSAEGVAPMNFGIAVKDSGNNHIEGTVVTLSKDWEQYVEIVSIPGDYPGLKFLEFGVPTTHTNLAGQGFMLDDLYVAEEVLYDIILTGDTKIIKGETIEIQADVVNQVGKKGSLSQECRWFITDLERNHVVEGFDIQKTQNGVSISLNNNAKTGKYLLVAMAGDIRKSIEIDVLSDFNDTKTPAMPENKIPDDRAGLESNDSWGGGNGYYADKWNYDGNFAGKKGQSMRFTALETGGTYVSSMGIAPFQMMVSNGAMYQDFEKGKDYVISIWVKDSKESQDTPYTKFSTLFRYKNQNEESINIFTKEIELTDQWQQYSDTVTLPSDFREALALRIGSREENPVSGQSFMVDELYVAEEIPYSMNIKGNGTIFAGESATFEASIRNQVGAEGNLKQDFSWYALDLNRDEVISGITITENQDGTVEVLADNTVSAGDYTIVAVSEEYNFVKGFVVTVNKKSEAISTLNFERTGNDVTLKASVENASAEQILFVIAEFNGTTLEKVTSVTKGKNDANCDLTLKGVKTGNTIKAFIWNMGTLIPIDNSKNFNMNYLVE